MTRRAPVAISPTDIDITEVMARIPHRFPFLLVDRCEDYKPSESIVGIKCVTVNEPIFGTGATGTYSASKWPPP